MANIRKLSSGKWNVQVRRHGHPSVSKTFNTQADARKWAKDVEVQMDRGIFIDRSEAERTTLAEALDRYAKEITPLKKSKDREAVRIDQLKRHPLAKRSLASLKPSDWSQYRDERLAQGKATNTVIGWNWPLCPTCSRLHRRNGASS